MQSYTHVTCLTSWVADNANETLYNKNQQHNVPLSKAHLPCQRYHRSLATLQAQAMVDGVESTASVAHIAPVAPEAEYFPFGGAGTAPAARAGHVAEIAMATASHARAVVLSVV